MSLEYESIHRYRKCVYGDADIPRPIPPGLAAKHEEVFRIQRDHFGISQLSIDMHTVVFMLWKLTDEGRAFYGDEKKQSAPPAPPVDWYTIPAGTPVVAHGKRGSLLGMTEKKRVQFKTEDGTVATYWPSEVQLAN